MAKIPRIDKKLLDLPVQEEKLASQWESLIGGFESASDPNIDPEGVKLAMQRGSELDERGVLGISHEEFLRRTELRD